MNKYKPYLFMLLVIGLFLPARVFSAGGPASVEQLINTAKQTVKIVNMAEFKVVYDKNDIGLLIDVRDHDEYAAGHIPGAVNVSRGTIEFKIWKLVGGAEKPDYNKKMMLYCGSGARCVLATKSLVELGFTNATAIDMKLAEWMKAGYPIEASQ